MTVLITLTIAGTDTGPFDLYSDVDGFVSAFETGVSKSALLAGYSSSLVPNGTTVIRIKSSGVCTNFIDVTVTTTTTTTTSTSSSTTTTTTTVAPTTADIEIGNTSLDVPVTGMSINSSAVTYNSGTDFTINAGDPIGYFTTNELGTYTVDITYGPCIAGQNILFVDSDGTSTCHNANPGGGTFTIPGAVVTGGTTLYVIVTDGVCA